MSDDIVIRLRDIAQLRGDMSGRVIPVTCWEAADEIERLRAAGDAMADEFTGIAEYAAIEASTLAVWQEVRDA